MISKSTSEGNMFDKIKEFLEKWQMTLVSGVFLLASFILEKTIGELPIYLNPAWISVIVSGIPLLIEAVDRLIHGKWLAKISSCLLISAAMIAAIIIGDLFAAGEVAFIMALGELLEDLTTERAKKGLKKLIELTPSEGRVIKDGKEVMTGAELIVPGDIIRVLPGESIPVDGVIKAGTTSVDQSIVTGESMPVDKTVGDEVFCGTVNRFGAIDFEATSGSRDSSLQRLIRLVQEAEEKKAPAARIADKWASILVPCAMLLAIATGIITQDITRAVTILVVFCPCALVLATPTAIMAAVGQAAKHGVIIKSGQALETMGKVNTITFDKTGTLTHGVISVHDVMPYGGISRDELLTYAASAESKSEHPLGRAVVQYAADSGIKITEPDSFEMEAGKGVCAVAGSDTIRVGNLKYLKLDSVPDEVASKLEEIGNGVISVSKNDEYIGSIIVADTIRPEAKDAIEKLGKMNVTPILLTGDNGRTADAVSKAVGIENVHSDLLPEEKVGKVEELRRSGKTVCMIGDGVNDAPALKTADVGIAMAEIGSDIAVDAADISLISDNLESLPYLKWLSNATVGTIRFSITLSMVINFAAIVLSVLGILNPTTGALVHNGGSLFVILIAALLYERKYKG